MATTMTITTTDSTAINQQTTSKRPIAARKLTFIRLQPKKIAGLPIQAKNETIKKIDHGPPSKLKLVEVNTQHSDNDKTCNSFSITSSSRPSTKEVPVQSKERASKEEDFTSSTSPKGGHDKHGVLLKNQPMKHNETRTNCPANSSSLNEGNANGLNLNDGTGNGTASTEAVKLIALKHGTTRKQQQKATGTLQAWFRGAMVRRNMPVYRLEHKLSCIERLKRKQLKKLAQRQVQKQHALRVEMEHTFEHRVLMRRLQKAEFLKTHFQKSVTAQQEQNQELERLCDEMHIENRGLAIDTAKSTMQTSAVRLEIFKLQHVERDLKDKLQVYQEAVEIFRSTINTFQL